MACILQRSVTGGLGSIQAEIMADTAVALASANVQLVSRKVIGRLCRVGSTFKLKYAFLMWWWVSIYRHVMQNRNLLILTTIILCRSVHSTSNPIQILTLTDIHSNSRVRGWSRPVWQSLKLVIICHILFIVHREDMHDSHTNSRTASDVGRHRHSCSIFTYVIIQWFIRW